MLLLIFLIYLSAEMVSEADKIRYISTEHPDATYFNPKYLSFLNITSRRYGRNDPFYYVSIHFSSLQPWSNNLTIDFYFFEWKSYNVYKPAFLEMHSKFCDLLEKDKFFGTALRKEIGHSCPMLPGEYHLYNMTIPVKHIPRSFPIKKGRIYCNTSVTDTHEVITSGYIDMEIKEYNTRGKINN